jgi:ribosomal protein S17
MKIKMSEWKALPNYKKTILSGEKYKIDYGKNNSAKLTKVSIIDTKRKSK